jgi:hypothetical protein
VLLQQKAQQIQLNFALLLAALTQAVPISADNQTQHTGTWQR